MAFDPDKYLAEKTGQGGFDPDKYLAEKSGAMPQQDQVSQLESLLRGGAQGATLGFADEISGAAQATPELLNALTGGGDLSSIKDKYTKARDESRAEFDKAQKTNPGSFLAGNLLGGIAPAVATAGMGVLPEAAGAGQAIANAAAVGGAYGGISGLGNSQADLTQGQVGQALGDTAKGAALGAATGGIIQGGISGAKSLGQGAANLLNKTEAGSTLTGAAKMGYNGENLLSSATRKSIGQEPYEAAQSYVDQLIGEQGLKSQKGQAFNDLLSQYQNHEIDFESVMPQAEKLIQQLDDRVLEQAQDKQKLVKLMQNFFGNAEEEPVTQALNYSDAKSLKGGLQNYSSFQKGLSSTQGENVAGQLAKTVGEATEQTVPGLEKANDEYHALDQLLKELGINDQDPTAAAKKIAKLFQRNKSETLTGDSKRFELGEVINKLKNVSPELADKMEADAQSIGKRVEIARKATNESFPGNSAMGAVIGASTKTANLAGQGVRKASDILYTMPKEGLRSAAKYVSQLGDTGVKLGNILNEAASRDDVGKNALLFTIMQQPQYRQLLQGDELAKENGK